MIKQDVCKIISATETSFGVHFTKRKMVTHPPSRFHTDLTSEIKKVYVSRGAAAVVCCLCDLCCELSNTFFPPAILETAFKISVIVLFDAKCSMRSVEN